MENRKKELINQYKERKVTGGVYKITNTTNGKYLLSHAVDLQGSFNRFNFSVATGSCVNLKLEKDWKEFGAQSFTFDIIEEIEINPEQSQKDFINDLKILEQLWREKLDSSNEY